ncbi:MAG TPA: hypothetical protein VLD59_16395, partial [Steroidobacteraceae bacterium]|nr:hypothetical protein [Steroidobacteraceae bacterium]
QALNPYSYVMNNPLTLIDPSGYSWLSKQWKSVKKAVKGAFKRLGRWLKDSAAEILAAAFAMMFPGGWAKLIVGTVISTALNGGLTVGYSWGFAPVGPRRGLPGLGGGTPGVGTPGINPTPQIPGLMSLDDDAYQYHENRWYRNPYILRYGLVSVAIEGGITRITIRGSVSGNDPKYDQRVADAINRFWSAGPFVAPNGKTYVLDAQVTVAYPRGPIRVFVPAYAGGESPPTPNADAPETRTYLAGIYMTAPLMRWDRNFDYRAAHEFGHTLGFHNIHGFATDIMNENSATGRVRAYHAQILEEMYAR